MKIFKDANRMNIVRYVSIGLTLLGSVLILLSFGKDFVLFDLKGYIGPHGFLSEANLGSFLDFLLWITVFFPFANAILHFITAPCRVIRHNLVSLIVSPIIASFSFLQMSVCVFIGLVVIFGGVANSVENNTLTGIILVVLSILIFGFFGMWKKPHEYRTRTNFLVINNSRTSVHTFSYLFLIFSMVRDHSHSGFYLILVGSIICLFGSIVEFIIEEVSYPPNKGFDKNNSDAKSSKVGIFSKIFEKINPSRT